MAHDDLIARPERQAPEAQARLTVFADEYAKRSAEIEAAEEALRTERDDAVRAAYRDGLPMATIATTLGISHQRVSQIVRS